MAGFVYIMSNPSFADGRIKIGKSKGDPDEDRKSELNTTGVPEEFRVEYSAYVQNHHDLENKIHRHFQAQRPNKKREFFTCSIMDAISAIQSIAGETLKYEENHYAEYEEYKRQQIVYELLEKLRHQKEEKLRLQKVEEERLEKIRLQQEEEERLEKLRLQQEEEERLEKIRLQQEEEERLEKLRLQQEEEERLEKIRLQQEEEERLEQLRLEREEEERILQEGEVLLKSRLIEKAEEERLEKLRINRERKETLQKHKELKKQLQSECLELHERAWSSVEPFLRASTDTEFHKKGLLNLKEDLMEAGNSEQHSRQLIQKMPGNLRILEEMFPRIPSAPSIIRDFNKKFSVPLFSEGGLEERIEKFRRRMIISLVGTGSKIEKAMEEFFSLYHGLLSPLGVLRSISLRDYSEQQMKLWKKELPLKNEEKRVLREVEIQKEEVRVQEESKRLEKLRIEKEKKERIRREKKEIAEKFRIQKKEEKRVRREEEVLIRRAEEERIRAEEERIRAEEERRRREEDIIIEKYKVLKKKEEQLEENRLQKEEEERLEIIRQQIEEEERVVREQKAAVKWRKNKEARLREEEVNRLQQRERERREHGYYDDEDHS
jgi:hypothetical protein